MCEKVSWLAQLWLDIKPSSEYDLYVDKIILGTHLNHDFPHFQQGTVSLVAVKSPRLDRFRGSCVGTFEALAISISMVT